jgi:hypothetical protein
MDFTLYIRYVENSQLKWHVNLPALKTKVSVLLRCTKEGMIPPNLSRLLHMDLSREYEYELTLLSVLFYSKQATQGNLYMIHLSCGSVTLPPAKHRADRPSAMPVSKLRHSLPHASIPCPGYFLD